MIPSSSLRILIKELRGTPFTLMAFMMMINQSITVAILAENSGYSPPTVRKALAFLERYGYAAQAPSGFWHLTETAAVIYDSLVENGHSFQAENNFSGPGGHDPDEKKIFRSETKFRPVSEKIFLQDEKYFPDGFNFQGVKVLNLENQGEEEELKPEKENSDSFLNLTLPGQKKNLLSGPGENKFSSEPEEKYFSEAPKFEKMEIGRILDATGWLFGERVSGRPEQYRDARLLIGSIASAYDNRSQLRKPARVVYANLKAGRKPNPKYIHDPQAYLPEEFCRHIGLKGSIPEFGKFGEQEPEVALPPAEPEALAWFERLTQVSRTYLDWATYHRYFENADLICCDLESGEFVITADDEPSAVWLTGHLAPYLQNDLLGIARRKLTVRFEVWPPVKPGNDES